MRHRASDCLDPERFREIPYFRWYGARAYYNLADLMVQMDRAHESAELARDGLALARSVGNRYWEWSFLGFAYPLFALGDWDDVVARGVRPVHGDEGLDRRDCRYR